MSCLRCPKIKGGDFTHSAMGRGTRPCPEASTLEERE
jgi:hypothetical protein